MLRYGLLDAEVLCGIWLTLQVTAVASSSPRGMLRYAVDTALNALRPLLLLVIPLGMLRCGFHDVECPVVTVIAGSFP